MAGKRVIHLRNPRDPNNPFVRVDQASGVRWASCERKKIDRIGWPTPIRPTPLFSGDFNAFNDDLLELLGIFIIGGFVGFPTVAAEGIVISVTSPAIIPFAVGVYLLADFMARLAELFPSLSFWLPAKPANFTKFTQPCSRENYEGD